jgi:transcriptional regulator with XRE-family HTH domain
MHDKRTSRSISDEHRALGVIVRQLRARHAISQEGLGDRAGLHRNYVGAIERGEINPTFRTLLALCKGLDVSLSTVLRLCEQRQGAPVGAPHAPRAEARGGGAAAC